MRTELLTDLDEVESLCVYMEDLSDIWQTRVIRTLCKVLYHILTYLVRRERRGEI
jgi:hypothetical protein